MKGLAFLLLCVAGRVAADSCSVSVPSLLSSVSLPPTIESAIADAYEYAGNILEMGSIVSVIELTEPTLLTAESVIASYEESYSTLISYIEQVYHTPSILPPSSHTSFSAMTSLHSTLASAVSTIVSVEMLHPSLLTLQSTLQYIEKTQSSILTYLLEYTAIASPTLYADTLLVEAATLTSPSIVPTFIAVETAVDGYQAVYSALAALSSEMYSLPLSIDSLIIGYIYSPSVVPPSVRSLLSSCYPDVYSALSTVTEFTKSHTTVLTAITNYLSVAETVSSLGSALKEVVSKLMPTLSYQISVMSRVESTWPSVYTDMQFISGLIATSPSLYHALTTIEETFYSDPSVAASIYIALESPSTITSPTKISYDKIAHQSFVQAFAEIYSFESVYTSYASTMCSIMSELTQAFVTERTLLTAASYLSDAISPDSFSASQAINTLFTVVTDLTTIMDEVTDATYYDTTLLCYEQTLEEDAYSYPQYAFDLWTVYNSPSEITSKFTYYSGLAADYSSLAYAIYKVVSAESSYPLLDVAEYSFLVAAGRDSSVLTDFHTITNLLSTLGSEEATMSS